MIIVLRLINMSDLNVYCLYYFISYIISVNMFVQSHDQRIG